LNALVFNSAERFFNVLLNCLVKPTVELMIINRSYLLDKGVDVVDDSDDSMRL
jgi:hypothetical protein